MYQMYKMNTEKDTKSSTRTTLEKLQAPAITASSSVYSNKQCSRIAGSNRPQPLLVKSYKLPLEELQYCTQLRYLTKIWGLLSLEAFQYYWIKHIENLIERRRRLKRETRSKEMAEKLFPAPPCPPVARKLHLKAVVTGPQSQTLFLRSVAIIQIRKT
jgi:hypothetical protein